MTRACVLFVRGKASRALRLTYASVVAYQSSRFETHAVDSPRGRTIMRENFYGKRGERASEHRKSSRPYRGKKEWEIVVTRNKKTNAIFIALDVILLRAIHSP